MPNPPNSVIIINDSSDSDSTLESFQNSIVLLASSSDESDTADLSLHKESHVPTPTIPVVPAAFESVKYGRSNGPEKEEDKNRVSDSNEQEINTCEQLTAHIKTTIPVLTISSESQYSATGKSNDDPSVKMDALRSADSDVPMCMHLIPSSELQAQQRELDKPQTQAHCASKSVPSNTTHRKPNIGIKRKATDIVSAAHISCTKSLVVKTTTSPLKVGLLGSHSTVSSSPVKKNGVGNAKAKPMALQDVVAQEFELARLCNKIENQESDAVKKKKNERKLTPSVPRSSRSPPFSNQDITADEIEISDDDYIKEDVPLQHQPSPKKMVSKMNNQKSNEEEEYTYNMPENPILLHIVGHTSEQNRKYGKANDVAVSKKTSKSKRKKKKKKSRPLLAKVCIDTPTQDGRFSAKPMHRRNARDTVLPGTVWRNVFFDAAPSNLLALNVCVSHPFCSEFDRPLLTYDADGDLRSKCKILPHFGKPTQCVSSTLASVETEQIITRQDIETRVTELIHRELPRLRACHQRKTTAILEEARAKVRAYLAAHETLMKQGMQLQTQSKRLGDVDILNKSLLNQMKRDKLTQALSLGYVNVWGEMSNVIEQVFIQNVNQLPYIRPLSKCTAYIGVKANIRVEDDPILRYKPYFGEDDDGADIDQAWYDAMEPPNSSRFVGLDGEVNEMLLRLVVHECGATDNVFSALNKVSGFAQAYSDYSEIKKLDDSACLAARRIEEAKELIANKPEGFPLAKVMTLAPSLRGYHDCQQTLTERLAPPPSYFDSNLARYHLDRGYGLGLRSTENYAELLVTYRDMFCRMCYNYHCLEHGIEHPLPSHRVDPVNPPTHLSAVAFASLAKLHSGDDLRPIDRRSASCASSGDADASSSSSYTAEDSLQNGSTRTEIDDGEEHGRSERNDVAATDQEVDNTEGLHKTRRSSRVSSRVSTLANQSLTKQGTQPFRRKHSGVHDVQVYPQVADKSEYLDDSYYGHVTAIIKRSEQAEERCSSECWKSMRNTTSTDANYVSDEAKHGSNLLSNTELTLLRKLRAIIGDNPCIISSLIKSTKCLEVGMFMEVECNKKRICTSSMGGKPLSREARSNHNGRKRDRAKSARSSNNRILLNRIRNNFVTDKRANNGYEPCDHQGACDSTDCSCMDRDHTCDKACSCSRTCLNRFPGCKCSRGNCRTKACPCFIAARECNPDLCVTCGASEVPALVFDTQRKNMSALDLGICCNVSILRGMHKRVGVAYSTTHGWGAFALEPIKRGEFIYEYYGALLSHDEAERRGSIYDKMTISFLFDVDDDSVVDAIRKGNKSKFANHSTTNKKCKGKVVTVGGEHRISIWAQQDISKGEELFFDYGYQGESAPDWSQLCIKGSARQGSEKVADVEKKKEG